MNMAGRSFKEDIVQIFLNKLVKKSFTHCNNHCELALREEDATRLSYFLLKEGYFEENNFQCCIVCALEKLEAKLIQQMASHLEIIRKARFLCLQPENSEHYQICRNHLAINRNQNQHVVTGHQPQLLPLIPLPVYQIIPEFIPIHVILPPHPYLQEISCTVPVIPPITTPYDSFVEIPSGIDPIYFMTNYYEWANHLQRDHGNHKRMAYTKMFKLEPPEDDQVEH